MHFQAKKMAVLHQLNRESEPVSLNKLIETLEGNYSERSVRRWLNEMINKGLVEKFGNKRGTKYQAIQTVASFQNSNGLCFQESNVKGSFGLKSKKIIEQVRLPLYERVPIAYADDWFEAYLPNITFYIPLELRLQLHQAGKRSKFEDPAGTYAHQIFNRLLIDLSYNSSRLEGNTYSLLDTQKLLLQGTGAEGKLDEEKIMILNHKEAIAYLVNNAQKSAVNKQTICTLHYLLSDSLVESCYSGKIRDHGVRIGGSTYIPFEDPKQLQMRLEKITEKAACIENPYEQSLFLLIHISYLQAFSDVNKRTARLSSNIPLIKSNLVPLSFNDVGREDYISSMIAIYELQEIGPILDLYVFSYMRTCAMYDSTIKTVGFDEIRARYRQQRRAILRDIIVNHMTGRVLNEYISSQTQKLIKKEDQEAFIKDIQEDLIEISPSRIAGLGITQDQLADWINVRKAT